jgi:hypothetical protein
VVLREWTCGCLHCTDLERSQNFQRMQVVCFLLLLYSGAFCLCVKKNKKIKNKEGVQMIKRKCIVTDIDTQEIDYSVK